MLYVGVGTKGTISITINSKYVFSRLMYRVIHVFLISGAYPEVKILS
jgi:hypothetical protein